MRFLLFTRCIAVCLLLFTASACNLSDDGPTLAEPANNANNANNSNNGSGSNNSNNSNNNAESCDECDVCDADPTNDCVQDCAGEWGGEAMEDACGVCDADPSNDCVADCAGNPGGDALADMCGTCDADPNNDCVQDCAGEWGGEAMSDMCGTCDTDPNNDCVQDCYGEYGGLAIIDGCGRCAEGNTGLFACPTVVLAPVEDAYVHTTTPDSNFGTLSELQVDSQAGQTFIKFDLSSLPTDIAIRSLRLSGTVFETQSFGGTGEIQIHTALDSWAENQITWNSRPRMTSNIYGLLNVGGAVNGVDTFVEFFDTLDLVAQVQNEVWGDKIVTLVLDSENYRANFYSRESGDPSKHFQLEVSYQDLKVVDVPVAADTYVMSNAPNKNFGSEVELSVVPGSSEVLVKFDLTSLPDTARIERASLHLLAYQGFAYGGDGNVYTYLLNDDTWDEATVSYGTTPSSQVDAIGYWWLWYDRTPRDEWGVNGSPLLLPSLQDALFGDKLVSYRLASPGYSTQYRSREFTDAAKWPYMKVYYTAD